MGLPQHTSLRKFDTGLVRYSDAYCIQIPLLFNYELAESGMGSLSNQKLPGVSISLWSQDPVLSLAQGLQAWEPICNKKAVTVGARNPNAFSFGMVQSGSNAEWF